MLSVYPGLPAGAARDGQTLDCVPGRSARDLHPINVCASFLLTEVVGYPAFLWALLAFQAAMSKVTRADEMIY